MNEKELNEVRMRRLASCIDAAETMYEVDGYGLAELIGMSKSYWTRNMNLPWGKKSTRLFVGLANLTGVSVSWLIAEELDPEFNR